MDTTVIQHYFNPLERLGVRKYSYKLPLLVNLVVSILSELFAYKVLHNPTGVGSYIIFISVVLIIYFAFRDGIIGGFTSVFTTIGYYLYIILSRHYEGDRLTVGIEVTIALTFFYLFLAGVVGWLKQRIDILIEQEMQARREAEDGQLRLETILQQLPVGVLLVDTINGKMDGNRQMEKILGRKIPTVLRMNETDAPYAYKSGKELIPSEWPIMQSLTDGKTVSDEELEFVRRDKKRVHLRVNSAPIRNKQKKIIAAVSTLYDITQIKELEQRKDDFVNMASHELKTPITSMKLYIEILIKWMEKYEDPKIVKTLNSIKIQTERLQELVSDLLDVSRIQTGKLYFKKEDFDLVDLIEETVGILQGTTKQQTLVFTHRKPLMVFGDKFRLYQVITNLITNAIKYSPAKTKIIIKTRTDAGKVVVSVQDFGIGVERDQQNKIFERLYQVADAKEKMYPGLGMGLYISKEIIKRHKGKIWVEGVKGKGSIFYFSLPLRK